MIRVILVLVSPCSLWKFSPIEGDIKMCQGRSNQRMLQVLRGTYSVCRPVHQYIILFTQWEMVIVTGSIYWGFTLVSSGGPSEHLTHISSRSAHNNPLRKVVRAFPLSLGEWESRGVKNEATCPRSQVSKWQRWDLNPGSLTVKLTLSTAESRLSVAYPRVLWGRRHAECWGHNGR